MFNCDNNDESFFPLSGDLRASLLVEGETFLDVFDLGDLGVSIICIDCDLSYSAFNLI